MLKLYTNSYTKNKSNISKHSRIILSLFLVLFIIIISGCEKEPIKIAFIGDLSSKNSQLAIDARNAIDLAVQIANEDGGVNGRSIQLVVKDDEGSVDVALEKHKEIVNDDIKFVLGHLNSNMAPAIMESESENLMFVSPSMSTTVLSKQDDYFIRSAPVNSKQADMFCEYALKENLQDIVIVYDLMNEQYSRTVAEGVELIMEEYDNPIKEMIAYDTRTDDLFEVSKDIIESEPKNVFVIAQASDTAYLIQQVKNEISELNAFSVSWSMTKDFISNGGKSVEGTKFIGIFIPAKFTDEYKSFADSFHEYYGYDLSFIGVLAYDAFNIYIRVMEEAKELEPASVKKTIIDIGRFEGLYGEYNIDAYGDNNKQYMIYELINGEFLALRDWKD